MKLDLDVVGQIKAIVEGSTKLVWSIFIACSIALIIGHFWPHMFFGLPIWVFPALRLAAILTGVLCLITLIKPVVKGIGRAASIAFGPVSGSRIRSRLLEVSLAELAYLCVAIARTDRHCRLNPDDPVVISLVDKKLLSQPIYGVIIADGKSGFEIPEEVWREMHSMREFRLERPHEFLRVAGSNANNPQKIGSCCLMSILP